MCTSRSDQPTAPSRTQPQRRNPDMARTTSPKSNKVDPTRPFYAAVGGVDAAVAYARSGFGEAQTRFAKVDFEPRALANQGRTIVTARVDELQKEAKAL